MSFYNRDKNPFPFYGLDGDVWTNTKPKWHSTNCKGCCYKHKVTVGTQYFQLKIDRSIIGVSEINAVELRLKSDNSIVDDTQKVLHVFVDQDENKYLMIEMQIEQSMVGEEHYVSVDTEQGNFYSEHFCVVQSIAEGVTIDFSSSTGKVGSMIYALNFKHSVNLEAVMVQTEPEIEETTDEDGYGNEVPTLQILKQGYELSLLVPNFLAQALSAIPLHDKVIFINRSLGESQDELIIENKYITVSAVPEPDGCNSIVEIKFVDHNIIKTACDAHLVALNNPPVADIVWDDTETTEPRNCPSDGVCSETLKSTELTSDPDGNLDTLEWERSDDNGDTWTSLGGGTTKTVNENTIGTYYYRLKATDIHGLIGISNIIRYRVFDNTQPSTPQLELLSTLGSFCSPSGGTVKWFDVTGSESQVVKAQLKVTEYYGNGFVLTVLDRNTDAVIHTWNGGPINSTEDFNLNLDAEGLGEFKLELCLNECVGHQYTTAKVLLTLYDTDNLTLTDQQMETERYFSCQ